MPRPNASRDMNHDPSNRRPRKPKSQQEDVLFAGWANFNFSSDQRNDFERWEGENMWSAVLDSAQVGGLKITLSYNAEQDSYLATAFVKSPESINAGLMTSQRSGTSFRALAKLLWAVYYGMGEDWSAHMTAGAHDW
jgi:hypothetical protein